MYIYIAKTSMKRIMCSGHSPHSYPLGSHKTTAPTTAVGEGYFMKCDDAKKRLFEFHQAGVILWWRLLSGDLSRWDMIYNWLVVWNIFLFHILGVVTPTDFHIFHRGSNHQPDNLVKSQQPHCNRALELWLVRGIIPN